MFGVFSRYELQLIHDWIRGAASADGQAFDQPDVPAGQRRATFRAASRLADRQAVCGAQPSGMLDADLQTLQAQLAAIGDTAQKKQLLIQAMSPARHWTPAGLYATRQFVRLA